MKHLTYFLLALFILSFSASAQDDSSNEGSNQAVSEASEEPAGKKLPKEVEEKPRKKFTLQDAWLENWYIKKAKRNIDKDDDEELAEIGKLPLDFGDTVNIKIRHLNSLIEDSMLLIGKVNLLLDDIEFNDINAFRCCETCNDLAFVLSRRNIDNKTLDELKRRAGLTDEEMGIRLNYQGAVWLDCCSPSVQVRLKAFRRNLNWSLGFTGLLLLGFIYLAFRTPFLKTLDQGSGEYVYSLSRSQLAFWTFIILASFFYIYVGTNDTEILNTTALVLLGISSVTTAVGQSINTPATNNRPLLKRANKGKNFFINIISDAKGVSVHRLQTVVFNLIFGIIFVRTVLVDLSMPDFSSDQLILLGISNGAYTALKPNEAKAAAAEEHAENESDNKAPIDGNPAQGQDQQAEG